MILNVPLLTFGDGRHLPESPGPECAFALLKALPARKHTSCEPLRAHAVLPHHRLVSYLSFFHAGVCGRVDHATQPGVCSPRPPEGLSWSGGSPRASTSLPAQAPQACLLVPAQHRRARGRPRGRLQAVVGVSLAHVESLKSQGRPRPLCHTHRRCPCRQGAGEAARSLSEPEARALVRCPSRSCACPLRAFPPPAVLSQPVTSLCSGKLLLPAPPYSEQLSVPSEDRRAGRRPDTECPGLARGARGGPRFAPASASLVCGGGLAARRPWKDAGGSSTSQKPAGLSLRTCTPTNRPPQHVLNFTQVWISPDAHAFLTGLSSVFLQKVCHLSESGPGGEGAAARTRARTSYTGNGRAASEPGEATIPSPPGPTVPTDDCPHAELRTQTQSHFHDLL